MDFSAKTCGLSHWEQKSFARIEIIPAVFNSPRNAMRRTKEKCNACYRHFGFGIRPVEHPY